MRHLKWFRSLPTGTQEMLEDWEEIGPPHAPYQTHYIVDEVATALRLEPVTVRQYLREGKLLGRKIGRKWQVSSDSIVRYIYNASHEEEADPDIPMGVVFVWSDRMGELLADYRFVSNRELETFSSYEVVYAFMDINSDTNYWIELWPIIACEHILEDVSLLDHSVDALATQRLHQPIFNLPHTIRHSMVHLAKQDWYRWPAEVISEEYRNMFGEKPTLNHLRLLKLALIGLTVVQADMFDKDLGERLEEIIEWNRLGDMPGLIAQREKNQDAGYSA